MKLKLSKLHLGFICSIVLALGLVSVVFAADVIIDSFDVAQQILFSTVTPASDFIDHPQILGGQRDAFLVRQVGSNQATLEINTGADGKLAFTAGSGNQTMAQIVWDGIDNDATTIAYDGLGGFSGNGNLLAGTNDGIVVDIFTWEGNSMDIVVQVFEFNGANDGALCSQATLELRGGGDVEPPGRTYGLSFTDNFIETCNNPPAPALTSPVQNFDNAGAIVLIIQTVEDGADIIMDLSVATQTRDFGDLPGDYNITTFAQDGARHSKSATFFGNIIDEEIDGVPSSGTDSDDNNNVLNDEEGVTIINPWTNGTDGGHVHFEINSPMTNKYACVDGWIDWNDDNDFDDANEHVIDSTLLFDLGIFDNLDQDFDVPADTFGNPGMLSFYSRWRISPDTNGNGDCSDEVNVAYDGFIQGGEVEDHLWVFNGPTAVNLQDFAADNNPSSLPLIGMAVLAVLAIVSIGLFFAGRKQKES